ncbi:uncharacterized protein LOC8056749 [Sorghum bicolor]|uniref:uncharacterized protein LOC8056749 n=1 Tax=Sorghum bicolor TaxID=4558 RepID=UPI000B4246C7|nr:uncharacterized protein LOC8056749 [Sorghum bicolor]|eukprot:XP_021319840.1 uncharacterized protein LOC8056749 [Sorghum bicolor]
MPGPSSSPTVAVINSDSDIMSTTTSRWASSLPDDLVRQIASLLLAGDLQDYVRFRAVCASWRFGTASPRGRGVVDPRFHPRRWMMLPEGGGLHPGHPKLHGYVRFFNLDTGAFVRVHIPLFQDHCVLDSMDGLLVLQRDHDTAVRVLHPFTGDIVDLPPLSTIPPQVQELVVGCPKQKKLPIIRRISAAATFADDGVVTVMLAMTNLYRVAFATSQDRQWTVPTWWHGISQPLLSSQGKIYVACEKTDNKTAKQCDSEVLVIGHTDVFRSRMVVYKLADLIMEMYIPLISIGDKAIFIKERALSVSAKALPTVTGDTIAAICLDLRRRQQQLSSTYSDVSTTTSLWASSLPDDLVRQIASLLLDYVRFRAVCASWRSGTTSPRGRGVVDPRFHPRRWMMLPEGGGLHPGHPKLHGYVRFFNLDTGQS